MKVIPPVQRKKSPNLKIGWKVSSDRIEHTQNKLVTTLVWIFSKTYQAFSNGPPRTAKGTNIVQVHRGKFIREFCHQSFHFSKQGHFQVPGVHLKKASELTPGSNHGRSRIQITNSARTNMKQFCFVMPKELSPKNSYGPLYWLFDRDPYTGL